MRNIGQKSLALLHEVGIKNLKDLRKFGALETYLELKKTNPNITKNMLWALLGAELNVDWRELPVELKRDLFKNLESS